MAQIASLWGTRRCRTKTCTRTTRRREGVPRSAPAARQSQTRQLVGLAKIIARHEAALQMLEADRSWIMFMDSGDLGITQQLLKTTASWKRSRAQGTCNCGLRQALMGALLMELEARMAKLLTDQDAQQKLISAGLLQKDPWRWTTRSDAEKQTHCPTTKEPLPHEQATAMVKELKPLFTKESTIHAFHAMTLFKLTISLEAQDQDKGGSDRTDRIIGAETHRHETSPRAKPPTAAKRTPGAASTPTKRNSEEQKVKRDAEVGPCRRGYIGGAANGPTANHFQFGQSQKA